MNAFSPEVIEQLGWVLVHSLWQFAVVAIVAGMLAAVLQRRSAKSRYVVLVTAMWLMVVLPCATWMMVQASDWASVLRDNAVAAISPPSILTPDESVSLLNQTSPSSEVAMNQTVFGDTSATGFDVDARTRKADAQPLAEVAWTELLRPWFSWIVGGWLIGVLLCSLRPLLGWRMLRRLRRIGISPPSDEVLAAFTRVSQQLGLRRAVKVFHSTLATGPLVVGYLKPVVLLPVSLVTSIPLSQLEAILAHELAHIRRHDFIVNLFQTLTETLFFYHPAVWWLSRRIRVEREHCCDDLVVKLFNNGVDYGRALLAIEQLQSQGTVLALGAADGSLLGRIRRISGATSHQYRFFPWLATPIALSVVCGMWMAGQEFNVVAETQVNVNSIAASEPESSPKPIQANLPNGVRVKLVGVTTPIVMIDDLRKRGFAGAIAPLPTAETPDTRQWWSGDGLKLDMAPEPGRSWMVRKEWEYGRQFAFEISGLPDGDSELNVVMFHDRATEPQQAVMIEVSKSQLDPGKRIVLGSIAPNAEAVSATLELRIGTEKSATVKFDTDGKRIDSLADDAALHRDSMKQMIANIKFLRVVQNGENAEVWTRPITTNGKLGSVRYSVLDKAGKSHSSYGEYSMNDEQLTPFKNLSVANIREIHFEIRAFDHCVRFENVSRKPRTKSEVKVTVAPLPKPPEPIQVRLPNNETIELLGVSTPPIELPSKDKREWWKGDGTAMEAAPIPRGSIHVGAAKIDGREFVVRASNLAGQLPIDVTLKERFKDGQPYQPVGNGWSQGSTHSGPIDENQKDKFQVTSEYVAGPVGDADFATLEVRVGSGFAAEMLFDVKGQRSNGDSKDDVWQLAAVKKMAESVEVLRTGPHEAGFAIWAKPFSSTTDEGTLDVALIDVDGQHHNPFMSGTDGHEAYYAFKLKPEEIDKFVVRLRPYQYVATFENVSLKPGNKSDVRVTVASSAAEKTPDVDIPASSDDRTDGEKASETPFGSQSNADIFPTQTDNDPSQISLRGLILNARNESIPNATVCVVIVDADDEKHRVSKVVKSNNDGLFQIIVPKEWATQSGRRHEIWAAAEGHQIEVVQLPTLDADSKPWDQQQCTLKLADASDYGVQIVGNAWADVETMSLVTPHEYVIRTEKKGTGISAFVGRVPRELAAIVGAKTDNQGDIKLPCVSPKRLQSLQVESKALGIQLLSPREERTAELRTKIGMKIVGRVDGRIRVTGGQMLDGIRIHANFNPVNISGEHSLQHVIVTPDSDGKFSFAMTQGKVDIWAEMPPDLPWFLRHQRHVLIEQNKTVTIDMQPETPVRVSGQVVSKEDQTPIAGLGILIRSPDGSGYETTVTDAKGKFSSRVLAGGVEIFTSGNWSIPRESTASINIPASDDEYILPTLKATPCNLTP